MTAPEWLAELRQAEQDATETPWRHDWQNDHRLPHGGTYVVRDQVGAELADTGPYKRGWNDALLIALLRNNAAALIAAAEAVERVRALCTAAEAIRDAQPFTEGIPAVLTTDEVRAELDGES